MTSVTVYRRGGDIIGIVCEGHTGYAAEGEDIVCAALSSITQTAVLGLMQVAKVNLELEINDEKAYLKFFLPREMSAQSASDARAILETMFLGIADLNESFSDFIELEVK